MENGILVFLLLLATVSLFILGIYLYVQNYRERREFSKRLGQIEAIIPDEQSGKEGRGTPRENRFLRFVGTLGKFVAPKKEENISAMTRMFYKAGYRKGNAPALFFGLKVLLAILFFGAISMGKLSFWPAIPSGQFTFLLFFFTFLGFYLPNFWIKLQISKRREKIQQALPNALDLMVVCVEAGVGLDAAINKVAEEIKKTYGMLADELNLVNLEIRAGKKREEALRNLVWRTDLDDLSSLVTLLIQTEKFGTSIAQALRVHADGMRTRRYQRAEEIAQKLPIKLIFPVALFILPMFLLVTLGPAIFAFMKVFGK
jgi:tight adherence protein C